jgi:uncharacterized phiE125 gp8 family phage protein
VALTIKTLATMLPVSLDEIKEHCRITGNSEDSSLYGWIGEAVETIEQRADRTLCTTTRLLTLDAFPRTILLPRPPLVSVSSIKYLDATGVQRTLAADQYRVDAVSTPGRIVPGYGLSWPVTLGVINAIEVEYVCGYGTPARVPHQAKSAIRLMVAYRNEFREPLITGTTATPLAETVDSLIAALWTGMLEYEGC